jgi:hypothetical protein
MARSSACCAAAPAASASFADGGWRGARGDRAPYASACAALSSKEITRAKCFARVTLASVVLQLWRRSCHGPPRRRPGERRKPEELPSARPTNEEALTWSNPNGAFYSGSSSTMETALQLRHGAAARVRHPDIGAIERDAHRAIAYGEGVTADVGVAIRVGVLVDAGVLGGTGVRVGVLVGAGVLDGVAVRVDVLVGRGDGLGVLVAVGKSVGTAAVVGVLLELSLLVTAAMACPPVPPVMAMAPARVPIAVRSNRKCRSRSTNLRSEYSCMIVVLS